MRLFVGIAIVETVKSQAGRVCAEIRARIGRPGSVRWVPQDNLHLTVRFIGHVPDDRATEVLRALDAPVVAPPFDIAFAGCGRFPPRGAPRVLWMGVTRGMAPLAALHQEFNRRLTPLGYRPRPPDSARTSRWRGSRTRWRRTRT
jgi:2'-5' RNA ligase